MKTRITFLSSVWVDEDMRPFLICPFMIQMLHNMKGQFAEHLMHAGFVSSPDPKDPKSNVNSGN